MNDRDLLRGAKEMGDCSIGGQLPGYEGRQVTTVEDLERWKLAALETAIEEAVAAEREACAKLVEAQHDNPKKYHDSWEWCDCQEIINAIRARGSSKT